MTAPVELVPLECLRCRTRLPAEEGELAWICPNCGQGQRLGDDASLIEIEIRFADGSPEASVRWFPFWVLHGNVRIQERLSYGGGQSPDPRWEAPQQFILPAFETTPEEAAQWGTRFLREPIGLRAGSPGTLSGVTVSPEEAQALAEFVVLSFEADRRDKLKSLRAVLDLGPPELWCLPFAASGGGSRLALAKV
jgi:hypothetical protein